MECHRCQHRKDVEAGKYARTAYEETPCGKCSLVENSAFTMEFDEGRPAKAEEMVVDVPFPEEQEQEERLPVSVLRDAIMSILSLRPGVRDVVTWRYAGLKYRDIALLQGVTAAAVEIRHKRALRRWPGLRALFAEKLAKQQRRKPHTRGRAGVSP